MEPSANSAACIFRAWLVGQRLVQPNRGFRLERHRPFRDRLGVRQFAGSPSLLRRHPRSRSQSAPPALTWAAFFLDKPRLFAYTAGAARVMRRAKMPHCRFSVADRGEAVPALRPAGILPAVGNKGRMPSPRRKSEIANVNPAEWRKGRRWGFKIPCPLRACGFDSHLGYYSSLVKRQAYIEEDAEWKM